MPRSSDVTWPIALSVSEALRGCSRVVYFPRREVPCRACLGTGATAAGDCRECEGTGQSEIIKRIPVDLPSLPGDLARIRVAGAGEYDEESGGFGDLSLICHVMPRDELDLIDGRLHVTVKLSPEQLERGGVFEVELPDETVSLELTGPLSEDERYELELPASESREELALIARVAVAEDAGTRGAHQVDSEEISRLHAEARNAEKARDFERARDAYSRLSEIAPGARTLRKCGWMHLRLDDLDAAIHYTTRAVDHEWTDAEAHYYKGAVHYKRREPLLAAVEMEYASTFGLDVQQLEQIRRRSLEDVFRPVEGLSETERKSHSALFDAVMERYYGAATASSRELMRSCRSARIYHQHGAANWLLSIAGREDRLAEAYLGLRAAAAMESEADEFRQDLVALESALAKTGTAATRVRIAGHLLRQGEAEAALEHTAAARDVIVHSGLRTDREAAALDEALHAGLASCARFTDAMQPAHRIWEDAVSTALRACGQLDALIEQLTPNGEPARRSDASAALKKASAMGRDHLLSLCARLQEHLEGGSRTLPRECHGWLEEVIRDAADLSQRLRQTVRMSSARVGRAGPHVSEQIEALKQLSNAAGAFAERMEVQYAALDSALSAAWRAWSQMLHTRVLLSRHVGRADHIECCTDLSRAVRLEQLARSMRPEVERSPAQRRATCRLLDDFQDTAQAAAGTGAFARAEFFQNTIDSLRGDLLPEELLADSPEEVLQESMIAVFDWACDVLFDGTTAFPQEFLIDARQGSWVLTNYRLAHRQTNATTFIVVPLTSIHRYDVRASGATTKVATLTLKDGRRISFNDIPTEHALPREQMSWLLAAEMWKTLTEAELEALEANRTAPTSQLPSEATHDRRRLLGDTRSEALGDGAKTVVCSHCARHNFRGDRFCRECGVAIDRDERSALRSEDVSALPDEAPRQEEGGDDALP